MIHGYQLTTFNTTMGDFYMTLPSNSSTDVYPDNSPGHFYTNLPQTYTLNEYEVGLSEIQFPSTLSNLTTDMIIVYKHDYEDALKTYTLPSGLYDSPSTIAKELNRLIENKKHRNKTKFVYNKSSRRTTLQVYKNEMILLTPSLSNLLQLPDYLIEGPVTMISGGDMEVSGNSVSMYVYCDIVSHRQVGDTMVPLLRTIPITDKQGSVIYQIFEKPHYLPLSRSTFSTIEVLLSNGQGETPHFAGDIKTVVTLHLRPRKYSS